MCLVSLVSPHQLSLSITFLCQGAEKAKPIEGHMTPALSIYTARKGIQVPKSGAESNLHV